MGNIHLGLNAEFSRSSDKPFEWAVKAAADMGYEFFEPMVHFGRELMSEAGYFHTVSMFDDPWRIKYTLQEAAFIAERRGIKIGLEPHAQYSRHPDGLDRIYNLVKSPAIGINFDTGNAYLCGHDVYAWLERVAERLVHLHAKDISVAHSQAERGKVTGTPVGCGCGEGVLDWERILRIVREKCPRDIVFSVECGTPAQAATSLDHLSRLLP